MIFHNFDFLTRDPVGFLLYAVSMLAVLVVSISVHEFSHALISNALGDPTARNLGRLSLNPRVHLDPMGGIALLLMGFGWGKPVPVNPYNLRINPLRGMSLIAVAGPVSNIMLATLLAVPFRLGLIHWPVGNPFGSTILEQGLYLGIVVNLMLAVFNLIPVAPLDGGNVLIGILPRNLAIQLTTWQKWGPGLLFGLIFIDILFNLGILWRVLGPGIHFLSVVFVGFELP